MKKLERICIIEMHINELLEDKLPIPESKSFAEYSVTA